MEEHPIGMFDSGLGGLTVMQQMMRTLPFEDIIYFGDTARLPYGAKSRETVIRYSLENSDFLTKKNIKLLVVACNTASAHALEVLQEQLSIPVMGVIGPGAKSALQTTKNGRIGVLGTKGTINSQSYQKAISKLDSKAKVFSTACPLFVPLVEEGYANHPATRLIVNEYLSPLRSQGIDTLLLGCTHYPLLKEAIRFELGDEVKIVDSAAACAEEVKQVLLRPRQNRTSRYGFYVSDDPDKFRTLGEVFLGGPIESVELFRA